MHMIGHGMALDQFNPLLLAPLPDDPPDTASELPIDDPASVLRHKNNVILAVPADVRWALPVSHENLLPSERGGSLKGGSLLHSAARRNGRASASLTARGGGLPVGVISFDDVFVDSDRGGEKADGPKFVPPVCLLDPGETLTNLSARVGFDLANDGRYRILWGNHDHQVDRVDVD